jgi:diguanylate cyclase (GGDEF)-like protein/PAS domain S-box-containing protein
MPRKKSADPRLSDAEALRGILDAVPHPIFVKDDESRFVMVNAAMCEFMGRSFSELVGRNDRDFVPKEQADIYRENDLRVLESGETNENEEPHSHSDGELRTIVTRKKRIVLSEGNPLLIGCITDISDFRRAEAAIRHNAEHDHLTGVANRSLFKRQLDEIVSSTARSGRSAALLLIDLDGFKGVNDALGHAAGDNVLVQAANSLSDIVNNPDHVARLGGDEFAIIQPPAAQPAAATALARAAVKRLSKPTFVGRKRVAISASVGISFVADTPSDSETLLKRADMALYAAKRDGRNCWRVFDESLVGRNRAA